MGTTTTHHKNPPQPESDEGFDDFVHTSALPPTHRNPPEPDPAAPKTPQQGPDHATQPSKRQPPEV